MDGFILSVKEEDLELLDFDSCTYLPIKEAGDATNQKRRRSEADRDELETSEPIELERVARRFDEAFIGKIRSLKRKENKRKNKMTERMP
jgi:hypothetical protein